MRAPTWLRTLARRKSGEEANAESARQLDSYFAPGGVISDAGITPGSDQVPLGLGYGQRSARPVPAWAPRRTYGGKGTIHRTSTIDVQLAPDGTVVAVWFRCLNLPFTVSRTEYDQPVINPAQRTAIEEITYVELPSEESSQ